MAVSDYSTTAASNTSISGINIAEGMAPSDVNNAMRQMMADIASWRATFDTTGNTTLGDAGTDTTTINGTAAIQNTSGSADATITFYRAQAGVGVGVGRISFDAQNASAARVTYGYTQMEMVATTAGAHTGRFTWVGYSAGTGSQWMALDSGNLLVGTTSAGDAGAVHRTSMRYAGGGISYGLGLRPDADTTTAISFANAAGSIIGSVSQSAAAVSFNTSSDYRLKTDLRPVADPVERLMQLKPINFAWLSNGERTDGFLAHEAQTVVPEAVTGERDATDEDGNPIYQGIDQAKLVPLLTAALQAAVERIEVLEARLTAAGIS